MHDDTAYPVDEENIISQLTTCENSLESLSDAFSCRKDDTIDVDDPGAMKIITTAGSMKNFGAKFKCAIS